MNLTIPTASKPYDCNVCHEKILYKELYSCIKLSMGSNHISKYSLRSGMYSTIRLHLVCFPTWAITRPRRKFNYRGGIPITIKTMVRTPNGAYAFEQVETPLTDLQKNRRKVLTTLFHRHKANRDIGYILAEMEDLGGIPKGWLR